MGFQLNVSNYFHTNLIRGRVEAQQVTVALLRACLRVVPVHILCSCPLQHGREQRIRGGVLQVKDAGGPAASGGLIEANRPPLRVILRNTQAGGNISSPFPHQNSCAVTLKTPLARSPKYLNF